MDCIKAEASWVGKEPCYVVIMDLQSRWEGNQDPDANDGGDTEDETAKRRCWRWLHQGTP